MLYAFKQNVLTKKLELVINVLQIFPCYQISLKEDNFFFSQGLWLRINKLRER